MLSPRFARRSVTEHLLTRVPKERQAKLASFISSLFSIYRELNFVYCEINPLVVVGEKVYYLDLAAKIDETAAFLNAQQWGQIDFPAPFGRKEFPEEAYIRELDSKTGASLKLTILNHSGRVWTMVAGGGASVVYADTISDYGFGHELANYGEYSGAPSQEHTFQYAKTLIGLMTKVRRNESRSTSSVTVLKSSDSYNCKNGLTLRCYSPLKRSSQHYDKAGKIFIIGGGIANFTDVAATFTGLIKALKNYQEELKAHHVQIYVRRAGPNYQEGLKMMRQCQER